MLVEPVVVEHLALVHILHVPSILLSLVVVQVVLLVTVEVPSFAVCSNLVHNWVHIAVGKIVHKSYQPLDLLVEFGLNILLCVIKT